MTWFWILMAVVLVVAELAILFGIGQAKKRWFCSNCRKWNELETAACSSCEAARRQGGDGEPQSGGAWERASAQMAGTYSSTEPR